MPGLLAIWVSAGLALITIFIMFQIAVPILGELQFHLDYLRENVLKDMIDPRWHNVYVNVSNYLINAFQYFFFLILISLIIFVIVQSARRRTDAYEEF